MAVMQAALASAAADGPALGAASVASADDAPAASAAASASVVGAQADPVAAAGPAAEAVPAVGPALGAPAAALPAAALGAPAEALPRRPHEATWAAIHLSLQPEIDRQLQTLQRPGAPPKAAIMKAPPKAAIVRHKTPPSRWPNVQAAAAAAVAPPGPGARPLVQAAAAAAVEPQAAAAAAATAAPFGGGMLAGLVPPPMERPRAASRRAHSRGPWNGSRQREESRRPRTASLGPAAAYGLDFAAEPGQASSSELDGSSAAAAPAIDPAVCISDADFTRLRAWVVTYGERPVHMALPEEDRIHRPCRASSSHRDRFVTVHGRLIRFAIAGYRIVYSSTVPYSTVHYCTRYMQRHTSHTSPVQVGTGQNCTAKCSTVEYGSHVGMTSVSVSPRPLMRRSVFSTLRIGMQAYHEPYNTVHYKTYCTVLQDLGAPK